MARVDIRYGYGSFGSVSSGTSDNHDGIGAQLFQAALGPELVPWSNRRGPHASVPAEGRVDGPDLGGSWVGVEGVAAGVGLRVDSCFSPFGLLRRVVLRSHQAVVVPLGFWDSQVLAVLSDGFNGQSGKSARRGPLQLAHCWGRLHWPSFLSGSHLAVVLPQFPQMGER